MELLLLTFVCVVQLSHFFELEMWQHLSANPAATANPDPDL